MVQLKSPQAEVTEVDPQTLRKWIDDGTAVVVDVREDYEHASERIDGAHLHPLTRFNPGAVREQHGDRRVVFQCRTGRRSFDAAQQYQRDAGEQAYHLAGGIEAWKNAGFETQRSASAPKIDVMRQVQMTAGSLVLIGVLLGAFVSPWFLVLSGFVGGGLVFAGATGWCGMAHLLAKMPWNRRTGASSGAA